MRPRTFVVLSGGLAERLATMPALTCDVPVAAIPPSIVDRLTAPTRDDLLPQVILDAPRGPAWQTDETEAPLGATVQHGVWAVLADALAGFYATLTRAGSSAFPSQSDETAIGAWEGDYGLPDPCLGDLPSLEERRNAIRAALVSADDSSRRALICLAAALGYDVTIDEWEGFELGQTGFGEDGEGFGQPDMPFVFTVNVDGIPVSWLTLGETGFGEDGFGAYPADGLLCAIAQAKQAHTKAYFLIDGVTL